MILKTQHTINTAQVLQASMKNIANQKNNEEYQKLRQNLSEIFLLFDIKQDENHQNFIN